MTTEQYIIAVLENATNATIGVALMSFSLCVVFLVKYLGQEECGFNFNKTDQKILKWSFITLIFSIVIRIFIP